MKKFVLLLPVLIIVATASFMLLKNDGAPKSPEVTQDSSVYRDDAAETPKTAETIFVRYSNSGFVPQKVTVTKGTTVSFINESEMPLWVASDPHPEHTDYPEFDTAKVNGGRRPQMGQNFDFTFEKAGTWNYHSHNASSDTGTEENHPGTIVVK